MTNDNPTTTDNVSKDLVPLDEYAIEPLLVNVEQAKKQWDNFQQLKQQLLTKNDYITTTKDGVMKNVPVKSAFIKYKTFYLLSDEIVKKELVNRVDGSFFIRTHVRVWSSKNPTYQATGIGICDALERCIWEDVVKTKGGQMIVDKPKCTADCNWRRHFNHFQHDIESTSHTRALMRAISNLVAGGEVGGDELVSNVKAYQSPNQLPSYTPPTRSSSSSTRQPPRSSSSAQLTE